MKKIIVSTLTAVLFLTVAQAQTMSEKEAKQFLETAWSYLKTSDSNAFADLWEYVSPEGSKKSIRKT